MISHLLSLADFLQPAQLVSQTFFAWPGTTTLQVDHMRSQPGDTGNTPVCRLPALAVICLIPIPVHYVNPNNYEPGPENRTIPTGNRKNIAFMQGVVAK